jgi:hypothetical protein
VKLWLIRERLNTGEFSAHFLGEILYDFAKIVKEEITQKLFREKAAKDEKRFAEFLLIETCRAILKMTPASFYLYLKHDRKLMDILRLKLLKMYRNYTDFDRKRKNLKMYMSKIIRRNLGTKDAEIYLFDTVVVEADLNKYKKGKKIKEGEYDVEFIHSTTKGTIAGFLAAVLINFSKLSVEHVELVSKKAKKVEIWRKCVLDQLGTQSGKIKVVIADAGFFAYDNYLSSPHQRLIPIIRPRKRFEEKVVTKVRNMSQSLFWYDSRHIHMLNRLINDFSYIINQTIKLVRDYGNMAKLRLKIEILFKIAKGIFGMEEIHVYYRKSGIWKITLMLYISSIFYQYLESNGVNVNRATELLRMKNGLW